MNDLGRIYDQLYMKKGHTFGFVPTNEVVRATQYVKPGKAFDIGCGLGYNSIYLALEGFSVRAIDISGYAIQKLREDAAAEELTITAEVADAMHELLAGDDYVLIINNHMLQDLVRNDGHYVIDLMQKRTAPGGVNVITAYGPEQAPNKTPTFEKYVYKKGEIPDLYRDKGWEILYLSECWERSGMGRKDFMIRIIARRPSS